ncbi:hypothetical protein AC1031_010300 [Aphanomyces cochlioides]|nr:hypothetical protein AC1031_010300 [Aphanomyces cochlioides]
MALVPPPRKSSVLSEASRVIRPEDRAFYPLPASAFHLPPLSALEIDSFVATASRSFDVLFNRCVSTELLWPPASQAHSVHLVYGNPITTRSASVFACAKMYATLGDIVALKDRTESIQHVAEDVLDSKILYEVVDTPRESIYVRWEALAFNLPLLHRDVCVVEAQREFDYVNGRRGWGFAQHSVNLDGCRELHEPPYNLVRGTMYHSGMLAFESGVHGLLDVYFQLEIDLKGLVPIWLTKMQVAKRAKRHLKALSTCIHEKRLTERIQYQFVVLVPKEERTHCSRCTKAFNAWRRKCYCRVCGEVFCWSCTQFWRVEQRPRRVCLLCASVYQAPAGQYYHDPLLNSNLQALISNGDVAVIPRRQRASTSVTARSTSLFGRRKLGLTSFEEKRSTEMLSDMDQFETVPSTEAIFGDDNRPPMLEALDSNRQTRGRRAKSEFYVW